jgi:hypothetical protein
MNATTSTIGTRLGQCFAAAAAIASFTIGVAISSSASAYADPADPSAPIVVDEAVPPPADNPAPPADDAEKKKKDEIAYDNQWGPYGFLNPNSPTNPSSPTNPNNWHYN